MCGAHYKRATGQSSVPLNDPIKDTSSKRHLPCIHPGGEDNQYCKGYCSVHYARKYINKTDMDKPRKISYAPGATCEVGGCSERPKARGMCVFHNQRRRQGVALDAPRRETAPGYLRSASLAAVERAVAYIRDAREDAEALFVGTGPYRDISSPSNDKLLNYATEMKALAATVGAEWVDAYAAFIEYANTHGGSINDLMYDSTHQNSAGNDLYAQTMLDSFPDVEVKVAPSLAPRARSGHYGISKVAKGAGLLGYQIAPAEGTAGGLTYALSGSGWSADGAYDVSSTAGDVITLTADAREFLYNIDMATNPVLDFVLDGVTVAADVDVSSLSSKNSTSYWLAPFLNLASGEHEAKLVVKGGTLRVQSSAALINAATGAGDFTPESRVVSLGSVATAAVDATGSYTDHFSFTFRVPDGWGAMSVQFIGNVTYRTTAATTEPRAIQARIEYTYGPFDYYLVAPADVGGAKSLFSTSFAHFVESVTADATVTLRSRVLSPQKTNVGTVAGSLRAIITRTA